MRRIVLLLSSMVAALVFASGVALADHLVNTVFCPTDQHGICEGTEESDHMYGTDAQDYIYAYDTAGTTKSMQTPGTIFSAVMRVMTLSTAAKVRTPWAVLAVTTGSSEKTSSTKSLGTRATTFSMAG